MAIDPPRARRDRSACRFLCAGAGLALLVALAGCAGRPPRDAGPRETTRNQPASSTQIARDLQERARAHTELGSQYYAIGNYNVAVEELKGALAADPNYVPALNVLGLTYMDLHDDEEATRNFKQALRSSPNDPEVNNNYGWFLCSRGRTRESIRYFDTALADPLYSTPLKSLLNAGICLRRAGDDAAAEGYLRKARAIAPADPQVIYQLSEISFRRGRLEQTRTLLDALPPTALGPEALWLGVRCARKQADRQAEDSYGLQLRRRFPESKEAALLTGGKYE